MGLFVFTLQELRTIAVPRTLFLDLFFLALTSGWVLSLHNHEGCFCTVIGPDVCVGGFWSQAVVCFLFQSVCISSS